MVIMLYHTDNGIINASYFMEDMYYNQKRIIFSGNSSWYEILQHSVTSINWLTCQVPCLCMIKLDGLRAHFPNDFWTMEMYYFYGYIIWFLSFILLYLILIYGQGQGLIQCHKPLVTFMFVVSQHIFLNKIFRSLEWKFLSGLSGFK